MVTRLNSLSFFGLKVIPVEIEVDIQVRVPAFDIVGLGGQAVVDGCKRIETAIQNSEFHFPGKRITVNLAPAAVRKLGPLFDLPIALGVLNEKFEFEGLESFVIIGELALNGAVRAVPGALPMAMKARELGFQKVICPVQNVREMRAVNGLTVCAAESLGQVVECLTGVKDWPPLPEDAAVSSASTGDDQRDMSDIKGQEAAKRALEIGAAGGHNMLMVGPPGTGKTMLARRIPTILPQMDREESLETTMIYSVAGMTDSQNPLLFRRPFRSPHHTASDAAVIGGGRIPRPGEVSLSHNGVLFLDELQLFRSNVLQVLREPLENGSISIARAEGSVEFPARFMLVAALNPSRRSVDLDQWDAGEMRALLQKLSGPLLDRIDLHVQVSRIPFDRLKTLPAGECSEAIRARVEKARQIQADRCCRQGVYTNACMSHPQVQKHCVLSSGGESLLKMAMEKFMLSIRVYDKILKVSRTIADLEGSESIRDYHVSEALQYRVLDRLARLDS